MHKNPLICAVDTSDLLYAKELIKEVSPYVGMVKLGLEFFISNGSIAVKEVVDTGIPVFLDLKLHDIPNTVAKAVSAVTELGVEMVTVHASGGKGMIDAAVSASGGKTKILAVTVLTSLDSNDLKAVGVNYDTSDQVLRLAKLSVDSEVDGIVCSANELEELKKIYNNKIKFVVPGIRPEGFPEGDQKRVMTPQQALNRGADFLVIGRPITASNNPALAAEKIFKEIS